MKKDKIVIGKIFSVHGIKGELKVYPLTDDINRFKLLDYVYIKDEKYSISSIRINKEVVLMKLKEIEDRTMAESFKNIHIEIDRKDSVPLEEDEYFIEDLKGLKLLDDNDKEIGVLYDVLTSGAVDVYEFKVEGKSILLPALKDNIKDINIQENYIKVKLENGVS